MIIDMHDVSYMESSGLGILAYAIKRLSPSSGIVNLVGCNSRISHILHAIQMSAFIVLNQNMDDIAKAISAPISQQKSSLQKNAGRIYFKEGDY